MCLSRNPGLLPNPGRVRLRFRGPVVDVICKYRWQFASSPFQHTPGHILVILSHDFQDSECILKNRDVVDFQNEPPVTANSFMSDDFVQVRRNAC